MNNGTGFRVVGVAWQEDSNLVFDYWVLNETPALPNPPINTDDLFLWNSNIFTVHLNTTAAQGKTLNVSSANITYVNSTWVNSTEVNVTNVLRANTIFELGTSLVNRYLLLSGGTLTGALVSQSISPSSDIFYNLGTPTARWLDIFTRNLNATGNVNATNITSIDGNFSGRVVGDEIFENGNRFPQAFVCPNGQFARQLSSNGLFSCAPEEPSPGFAVIANKTILSNMTDLNVSWNYNYTRIQVIFYINHTKGALTALGMRFNNDSTVNYSATRLTGATLVAQNGANHILFETTSVSRLRRAVVDLMNIGDGITLGGYLMTSNVTTNPRQAMFNPIQVKGEFAYRNLTTEAGVKTVTVFPITASSHIGFGSRIIVIGYNETAGN